METAKICPRKRSNGDRQQGSGKQQGRNVEYGRMASQGSTNPGGGLIYRFMPSRPFAGVSWPQRGGALSTKTLRRHAQLSHRLGTKASRVVGLAGEGELDCCRGPACGRPSLGVFPVSQETSSARVAFPPPHPRRGLAGISGGARKRHALHRAPRVSVPEAPTGLLALAGGKRHAPQCRQATADLRRF